MHRDRFYLLKDSRGFSLLELMVVLMSIMVLTALTIQAGKDFRQVSQEVVAVKRLYGLCEAGLRYWQAGASSVDVSFNVSDLVAARLIDSTYLTLDPSYQLVNSTIEDGIRVRAEVQSTSFQGTAAGLPGIEWDAALKRYIRECTASVSLYQRSAFIRFEGCYGNEVSNKCY